VHGGGMLGHLRLDGGEPARIVVALEQLVALPHGLFEIGSQSRRR
jgi:hypothetical protein